MKIFCFEILIFMHEKFREFRVLLLFSVRIEISFCYRRGQDGHLERSEPVSEPCEVNWTYVGVYDNKR